MISYIFFFFFQAEDGIRDFHVTGVQTCALPISPVRTVVAPAVVYHVQIGAFRLRENADTLVQLLGRDGFKPSVLESGKLFIVYLGTFTDQKDAARLANALRTRHYEVVVIAAPAQAAQH